MAPGEHGGWVAVDPDGREHHGTIVCTPEVCGGSGPGSFVQLLYGANTNLKFVLKTLQDPVEAAAAPNGVGSVVHRPGGTYNWSTGTWTYETGGGQVYEIPLAYPGTDRGGNTTVDILLYDPTNDDTIREIINDIGLPPSMRLPSQPTAEQEAAFRDLVRLALPTVETVEQNAGVVFTETAAERRTTIGTNIASAITRGGTSTGVQEAQKLVWLYTWAAVRGLPEDDRADVTADLRTPRGDTPIERRIRTQAQELALADVSASLMLTELAESDTRERCAIALTYAQGRIARNTCQVTT